jgi:geranylgeranyl diphosphate synthase, type I
MAFSSASITALPGAAAQAYGMWSDHAGLDDIEALMEQLCRDGGNPKVGAIAGEHIANGGKRLRARLALFGVRALGGPTTSGIGWGAACELLHNASLIHDDLQDGDRLRRGRPALWARHGAAQAINAGDLCIALGYAAIGAVPVDDATRWRLTSTMTTAARRIVSGQADELGLLSARLPDWADYAACVEGKTSALFSLPIEGAALIAGRERAEAAALADACRPLGLLFQIQDDILDLYGDNGRDRPGSDLAQAGKATAFVVEHLRLHPGDAAWLVAILTAPREQTAQADIDEAIRRFAAGGALWRRIDDIRATLAASAVLARERTVALLMRHFVETALAPVAHTRPAAAAMAAAREAG